MIDATWSAIIALSIVFAAVIALDVVLVRRALRRDRRRKRRHAAWYRGHDRRESQR